MRIRELSQRSGVPIPTIKYYLRERLLEPGAATAANQAVYTEDHVRRLRLIRALLDVGGVSVASARSVIEALGNAELRPHDLLGVAHNAVVPSRRPDRDNGAWVAARKAAGQYVADRGWMVHPEAVGIDLLADAMAALASLDVTEILDGVDRYADAAQSLASFEVSNVIARREAAEMLELVVVGTVLGEALLTSLRLLAHEHESAAQLGDSRTPLPAVDHEVSSMTRRRMYN